MGSKQRLYSKPVSKNTSSGVRLLLYNLHVVYIYNTNIYVRYRMSQSHHSNYFLADTILVHTQKPIHTSHSINISKNYTIYPLISNAHFSSAEIVHVWLVCCPFFCRRCCNHRKITKMKISRIQITRTKEKKEERKIQKQNEKKMDEK